MESYWIFKTDNLSGKTWQVCNGGHDTELECRNHWIIYLYGFMDAAREMLGTDFEMSMGKHELSFRLTSKDNKDVEYFMLLGKKGRDYLYELCKSELKNENN